MSVEWPEYVNEASELLRRGLEAVASVLNSASDMNVQGTGIAGLDSESHATPGRSRLGESSYVRAN